MASKTTKFLTQSITGALILSVAGTFLADWLKSVSLLTTLKSVLVWCYKACVWFLNAEIKVWWLLTGIALVLIMVLLFTSNSKTTPASFLRYKKDTFDKWIWKWEWRFNGSRYQINNLRPCCPICETPLMEQRSIWHGIYIMECPRDHELHKRGTEAHTEDINKIEVLILDNIDKGNYEGADNK